jgi:ketosteroid isomerase-like protein
MRTFLSLASVFLLLAVGCAPPSEVPEPEVDLAAERASLMQADAAWFETYSTGDSPADALVTGVVDDAYFLPPDAPLARGKEEIRAIIADLYAIPGFSLTWVASAAEVGAAGDLGFTIGAYEMELVGPEGTPIRIGGKYLTVWEKQSDGTWLVAADMFNADGPPSPIEE